MATAKRIEEVVQVVTPASVQLTLTQEEADAIFTLVGNCVSGGITSGVYEALSNVGCRDQIGFILERGEERRFWESGAFRIQRRNI